MTRTIRMRRLMTWASPLVMALLFVLAGPVSDVLAAKDHAAARRAALRAGDKPQKPKPKKGELKPYDQVIKDMVAIEGVFTFYHDTTKNSYMMALKPEQMDKLYLIGEAIIGGDGAFWEGGRMLGEYPIYFAKGPKNVMMMEKNLRLRADEGSTGALATERAVSDALIASVKIESKPHKETGAILVNPEAFFLRDAINNAFFIGQALRARIQFDSKASMYEQVKVFPTNAEISVRLFYGTNQPLWSAGPALQNPYSFSHLFNYSILELPENDFVPRLADHRIGTFNTLYMDYTSIDRKTPYVEYVNRWHLTPQDPDAEMSDPVEPLVFWIENTTPEKYRQAIKEGIEYWQGAFEEAGLSNAIQAKIMPDTADWDPADARFHVVRWSITKNNPYGAIGPSRVNPLTGQILDADVNFNADFVRGTRWSGKLRAKPVSFSGMPLDPEADPFVSAQQAHELSPKSTRSAMLCNLQSIATEVAARNVTAIRALGLDPISTDSLVDEYVIQHLRFVVAHEVGHTLGFRHNFEASTIYTFEQINDPAFTAKHSMVGTMMEYPAANLAGPGYEQGDFYPIAVGPYDKWITEYSYRDFGAETPEAEREQTLAIANRAAEPGLVYATDEDAFGLSTKSIDPYTNVWDVGADPIEYYERQLGITQNIWQEKLDRFAVDGAHWTEFRQAFQAGWSAYSLTALTIPKFVGGLRHNRYFIGDAEGVLPFEPVSRADQKRAMQLLTDHVFSADAFDIPADVVRRLQPDSRDDFTWSIRRAGLDYPFHQQVLARQQMALSQLMSSFTLGRMVNNVVRYDDPANAYTLLEMFEDLRSAVWSEALNRQPVNSLRRQLQLAHLDRLINVYLNLSSSLPADVKTVTANELAVIKQAASRAAEASVGNMSTIHYREVVRQIDAAQRAGMKY